MAAERKQFYTLHGLRGVAAIIVMLYHLWPYIRGRQNYTPGAYLAVDLFFILSGFVLAQAYDARLAAGMGAGTFARIRMIRLSPLYYLAIAIALIGVGVKMLLGMRYPATLWSSILAALAWLPLPPGLSVEPTELFPLNGPAWSLLLEVLVNLAYALVGARLGKRALILVILISGAALAFAAIHYGDINYGAGWRRGWVGIARVVFSFSFGVFLRRSMGQIRYWQSNILALAVLAAAAGVMLAPIHQRDWIDLTAVFVCWPLVIYFGARFEAAGRMQAWLASLGDLSYALYATHAPLLSLSAVVVALAMGRAWNDQGYGFGLGIVVGAVIFAGLAHHFYDAPVRAQLNRRLGRARG